jgi:hypothetical protein
MLCISVRHGGVEREPDTTEISTKHHNRPGPPPLHKKVTKFFVVFFTARKNDSKVSSYFVT